VKLPYFLTKNTAYRTGTQNRGPGQVSFFEILHRQLRRSPHTTGTDLPNRTPVHFGPQQPALCQVPPRQLELEERLGKELVLFEHFCRSH
jgi:hypothetical protein